MRIFLLLIGLISIFILTILNSYKFYKYNRKNKKNNSNYSNRQISKYNVINLNIDNCQDDNSKSLITNINNIKDQGNLLLNNNGNEISPVSKKLFNDAINNSIYIVNKITSFPQCLTTPSLVYGNWIFINIDPTLTNTLQVNSDNSCIFTSSFNGQNTIFNGTYDVSKNMINFPNYNFLIKNVDDNNIYLLDQNNNKNFAKRQIPTITTNPPETRLDDGSTCDSNLQCKSGYCSIIKKCESLRDKGSTCNSNSQCKSGLCAGRPIPKCT